MRSKGSGFIGLTMREVWLVLWFLMVCNFGLSMSWRWFSVFFFGGGGGGWCFHGKGLYFL